MALVLIEDSPLEKSSIEQKVNRLCAQFLEGRIKADSRVLIKPHLHMAVPCHAAVNTHPLLVASVAKWCLVQGARVRIADFPVFDPVDTIARKGGYVDVLTELDLELKTFLAVDKVDLGGVFGKKPIAREALTSDLVINLPKLKTDTLVGLQMGVANMIGCLAAEERIHSLSQTPFDRTAWSDLLIAVCEAIRPSLTIVDAIVALEGHGPGMAGRPRKLELLVAGSNPYAVDKATAALVGFDPGKLLTCKRAKETGVFNGDLKVLGDFRITTDFARPVKDMAASRKSWTQRERKYFLQRPVADNRLCKLCSACWQSCPVKAISFSTKGIRIDAAKCIRCYQCFGLCPHKALEIKTPLAGRLKGF